MENILDAWVDLSSSQACRHEQTICSLYGHTISMTCILCRKVIKFKLNKKTKSFLAIVNSTLSHRIGEVSYKKAISLMNASLTKILLPEGMDPESEYFEEDTERYFELLTILMENGFINSEIPKELFYKATFI